MSPDSRKFELIVKTACEIYDISREELFNPKLKIRRVSMVRNIVWHVIRSETHLTLKEINDRFGFFSHSSVQYGIERAEEVYMAEVNLLKEAVNEQGRLRVGVSTGNDGSGLGAAPTKRTGDKPVPLPGVRPAIGGTGRKVGRETKAVQRVRKGSR